MDTYNHNQVPNPNDNRPKGSLRWLMPTVFGIIIGVVIAILLIPTILGITDQGTQEGTNQEAPSETPSQPAQQVNVDVSTQITEIVERVLPTVVGVTNIQQRADFWRQQEDSEAGTGSGVIYKTDKDYAYVITNHHVIEGADMIEVVLSDETTVEAELLGSDLFTDLAVLRMDRSNIKQTIELGSSEKLKVGEPAIAIGNPLGHMFSGTVTQGIISSTQRTIPLDFNQDGRADWQAEVIQTDAAINPGNSGGALINIKGQLIGINSMKINQASVEGIGFAIPIDIALPVIDELEKTGEVTRPYLGVEIYSLEEVPKVEWARTLKLPEEVKGGVYIWGLEPLSPADQAGLQRLDVITHLDDEEILSTIDLRKVLYQEKDIGDEVKVTFYRDGKQHDVTIKLGVQK
ncbi:MAG TPA: trypsin-like peptidase domain-containing protein [Bacillota bacterium]|nr:trypsin-like peptidase domain-containing protein [Bacillota bacterium]